VRSYPVRTFADFATAREAESVVALDVRSEPEWRTSHVRDALHMSLPDLAEVADPGRRAADVTTGEVWVYCGGGFRAAVAASLLDASGAAVTLIDEPFGAAQAAGLTVAPGERSAVASI
jgi:rhodanese-related sulfurtransferase